MTTPCSVVLAVRLGIQTVLVPNDNFLSTQVDVAMSVEAQVGRDTSTDCFLAVPVTLCTYT